jgi:Rrf2 family protein
MKFASQGAQYSISAIIALSKVEKGKIVSASELSRMLNCPAAYLSQLLSKLKPSGIIKSQRGLNGGVYLAKDLSEVTVYDVVTIIDGDDFFNNCFMGIEGCGKIEPCPFHNFWSSERDNIKEWLRKTNFEEIDKLVTPSWFELNLSYTNGGRRP